MVLVEPALQVFHVAVDRLRPLGDAVEQVVQRMEASAS